MQIKTTKYCVWLTARKSESQSVENTKEIFLYQQGGN